MSLSTLLMVLAINAANAETCKLNYAVTEEGNPVLSPVQVTIKGNTFTKQFRTHRQSVDVPCGWKGVVKAEYKGMTRERMVEFRIMPKKGEHSVDVQLDFPLKAK